MGLSCTTSPNCASSLPMTRRAIRRFTATCDSLLLAMHNYILRDDGRALHAVLEARRNRSASDRTTGVFGGLGCVRGVASRSDKDATGHVLSSANSLMSFRAQRLQ